MALEAIAVVGLGGVFPGAADVDRLWDLVEAGKDVASEPPRGRWILSPERALAPERAQPDHVYARKGGFCRDFRFDPTGLEVDADVLMQLDPMVHLAVHAGREAWMAARTGPVDPRRVGVVLGNIVLPTTATAAMSDWTLGRRFQRELFRAAGVPLPPDDRVPVAALNRWVAGMPAAIVARALGLGGEHFTLDAACSSSLFALELAVDALRSGRADLMLTGGLARPDALYTQMGFSQLRALSPTGRCSPFDRRGDGLVVGEGAGVLALKRLSDAVRDGDRIRALVRGVGMSNDVDGNLLAPSDEGQLRAMRAAYAQAGWRPSDVQLVECHATGTPVGDGVELRSLAQLWADEPAGKWAALGAVKANVGHLLTGAGAVGLIKSILAMEHGVLPPVANFEQAPEDSPLHGGRFEALREASAWPTQPGPRRAAVSGFGFGGTNAHVLLEQAGAQTQPRAQVQVPARPDPAERIAIVGMDARVGPWTDLVALQRRLLGGGRAHEPAPRQADADPDAPVGWFIDAIDVAFGELRIPPREIEDALPQQILMLRVAKRAIEDAAGLEAVDRLRTGVFVGVELDLNTTNYHLRWSLRARAAEWAHALGRPTDGEEFEAWVDALCDALGPALDANRTMGGLGSITASRIARELGLGGPSYVLASEETSGLSALQSAVSALRRGQIDAAVVGAVDFCGDPRALIASDAEVGIASDGVARPFDRFAAGIVPADGAVGLVLERESDARRAGRRIYALVEGLGTASGEVGDASVLRRAIELARAEVALDGGPIGLVETHGSGVTTEDRAELEAIEACFSGDVVVGSAKACVGHVGAAAGLLSVLRASTCLYQQVLPALENLHHPRPRLRGLASLAAPEPWLRDRSSGPRRAGVNALSLTGAGAHVLLAADEQGPGIERERAQPLGEPEEALFVIEADSPDAIRAGLERLEAVAADAAALSVDRLARGWLRERGRDSGAALGLGLVVRNPDELRRVAGEARQAIARGADPTRVCAGRVFFTSDPVRSAGELAFVYPGSGSQFVGMGRRLALAWPRLLREQDAANEGLKAQLVPETIWRGDGSRLDDDARAVILSQVSLGTLGSDLARGFGLRPQAVIGYSLGETAGLFSFGAWHERDEMLRRAMESDLFTTQLAGPCLAARRAWGLAESESVCWSIGVVDRAAARVREALAAFPRAYLLIVNTPDECVIGGDAEHVAGVVEHLGAQLHPLRGVTTVHCEVAREVADAYRDIHVLDTRPPDDVRFYSGAWARAYPVDSARAADSLLAQALDGVDFPATIRRAYEDGVRVFLELGPGASCTRMIHKILAGRPFVARSLSSAGQDGPGNAMRTLGALIAQRVPVEIDALFPERREPAPEPAGRAIHVEVGPAPFGDLPIPSGPAPAVAQSSAPSSAEASAQSSAQSSAPSSPVVAAAVRAAENTARAHETYLRFASRVRDLAAEQVSLQLNLARGIDSAPGRVAAPSGPAPMLDRAACMELAVGSLAAAFGPQFAEVDTFATRVRLPDEPLMLVDRIMAIDGDPLSMTSGRVVTEHDVLPDGWYLDGGRIPTCIAIEAGQADLILSGWLGADFHTRGEAVYRLLDAEVVFSDELPRPGEVIHYDIRIKHFFQQGDTLLFRFEFDATVAGRPLMTMREGCAGFFSQAELDAGQGIVHSRLEQRAIAGTRPADWRELVPMTRESYDEAQLRALRAGDLEAAFGPAFGGLTLRRPLTIPTGRMQLVHRVVELDPQGGRYGMGSIKAEADIHPDDWFLTCHFCDDQVMPGTLMYECCLHTLRVFLLRMGWIAEADEACWQPIPGVKSRLKCRGQVLASTKVVTYEVWVRELGYGEGGTPFAICDALMHGDGKAIVDIRGMCIRLTGTHRAKLEAMWSAAGAAARGPAVLPAVYDEASIDAFAQGKPSDGYGAPYEIFDGPERRCARLPRDPYRYIDRVTAVQGEPFVMKAGATAEAQFDVAADAWFFASNRQREIPFAVLLEAPLQACGWLAAYVGSALTTDVDLRFRNLGGKATLHAPVLADDVLTSRVALTSVSSTAGMIIQHYSYTVVARGRGTVYEGTTYFGFFSEQALADQVGIREASPHVATEAERARARSFPVPDRAPLPDRRMRMVDQVDLLVLDGGPASLGYVEGSIDVDPDAWFFEAHFFEDPVWPGSLGLEAVLQLLKVFALERFGLGPRTEFRSVPLGRPHEWIYRGQIAPGCERVRIGASITAVDEVQKRIEAHAFVWVDGRPIYELRGFGVEVAS